jgi:hypothetical protein
MTSKNWFTDPRTGNHHIDGIPWHKAPQPRWLHRCRPWSIGPATPAGHDPMYRCACGSYRLASTRHWVAKNSRRRCKIR